MDVLEQYIIIQPGWSETNSLALAEAYWLKTFDSQEEVGALIGLHCGLEEGLKVRCISSANTLRLNTVWTSMGTELRLSSVLTLPGMVSHFAP